MVTAAKHEQSAGAGGVAVEKSMRSVSDIYGPFNNNNDDDDDDMASINIDPPVSTPAHEWAADTADAIHSTSVAAPPSNSTATYAREFGPPSLASTPGLELPGSFPRESRSQTQQSSTEDRAPHAAAAHLAEAAPPKSTAELQEAARGYLPNVGVQRAVDTAKAYLPERVVDAVGSVLPASMMTGTQTENNFDPTSSAKPASETSLSPGSTSLDNASTTTLPPSTRAASYTSDFSGGVHTPFGQPNAEPGKALDETSSAKPVTNTAGTSPTILANSASTAPVPGASSKATTTPVSTANVATAMHTLPTPPASKGSSPAASGKSTPHTPDIAASASRNVNDNASDAHVGGSGTNVVGSKQGPVPPPKDDSSPHESEAAKDAPSASQPTVNTTPGHEHVLSGSAVPAHVLGTAPVGENDARPSISPASSLSDTHVHDDGATGGTTIQPAGANASSSDDVMSEKKEGRMKGLVNKVKDKLSHRGH